MKALQARDLRIGNLAYRTNKSKGKRELIQITPSCVMDISANGEKSSFIYEPIPLTEEWLLRFGFSANNYKYEFQLYPLMFDCEYTDHGEWNISYDDYPLSTEINYVHQLQNLYFALTGEELTLKQ